MKIMNLALKILQYPAIDVKIMHIGLTTSGARSKLMETQAAPAITVYTGNDCIWCDKAKEYLKQRGLSYQEKNVEDDEAAAAEALALVGRRGVPIIVVGEHIIQGFQRERLDAVLG